MTTGYNSFFYVANLHFKGRDPRIYVFANSTRIQRFSPKASALQVKHDSSSQDESQRKLLLTTKI